MTIAELFQAILPYLVQVSQYLITLVVGQQQQATSSFAQQVANEQIARDQQTYNFLLSIYAKLQQMDADLSNLISNVYQRGEPVTLPSTPPAGYGGATAPAVASAVWAFPDPTTAQPAIDLLSDAGLLSINMSNGQVGLPAISNPPWVGAGAWDDPSGPMRPDINLPKADTSTILATDATVADWLNRVYSSFGTFLDFGDGWAYFPDSRGALNWVFWLSPSDFVAIKATLAPATAIAPVWPGSARVTIGASQALADGLLVPGPLDGVIIAITAVPSPISYYPFGPLRSYVHVGGIAFVDDNGEAETVQPIGLASNVVCPKSMTQAAHAYIRLQSGVTGTVRPWTSP